MKAFADGRKVSVVPTLLVNYEFICNSKIKANYFNRFFNHQSISTDSYIPSSSVNLASNETMITINFDKQLISKLTVTLNANKAHGYDELSIRMLQTPINV